ncbi:SusC/RagA family TonB-linked outer membrane protein [Portibacter lacus]|uniref:SusC/RagA family TonB-linked outer membrane protein n=2 Tax=Portibacter lacus TaxID=1099794 RepID=A0AA37SQA1_9BACT|nr:SusC/RagA family TonB-linked outer membrane protein [Portibacter lacus]
MTLSSSIFAQSSNYKGTVTASDLDEPLFGVSVLIKNTGNGTLTDLDGIFELEANSGDTLVLSYIGYKTQEIALSTQTQLEIVLGPDNEVLDEVVVIGYGTIKKSDLTGSVAKVTSKEITKVPSSNAIQALQGKVAGLQILSTSGDPGANPVVRLRGITTLNDNNPIAVIDGVITDVSAISLLNSSDIESVEVLKDASATAIYGSRGAAGVIIVTTKTGQSGKNKISFSIEQSIESISNEIEVMNGREFATYINQIEPGTYNNLDVLPDVNWLDHIINNNAPITNANMSISGGSENSTFYFGLGYFGQQGILDKSALDRLTAKLNSQYNLSRNINVGLNLSMLVSDKENSPGVINTALRAWPINEPFLEDGVTFADVTGGNALAAIEYSNSNSNSLRSLGNLYANFTFLNNFTFKSSLQFDFNAGKTKSFVPQYFVGPLQQNEVNDLSYSNSNSTDLIFENTLSYNNEVGRHRFAGVVGYSTQDRRNEFIAGNTEGLIREDPLFWYLDAGQNEFENVSNNAGRSTIISYLGRVNYSFDSRYLFTASLRRDGSSNFGKNNLYGYFPSVALGWNVSNEGFFNSDLINKLKIRGSVGGIGNEKIPGSAQYALIRGGTDAVFGEDESIYPGATFDGGGNPDLKWENTYQANVGFELGIMQDKLTVEMDYYYKNTTDILVPLEPAGYLGIGAFRSIFFNAANVTNKGLEWNARYRDNIGDFSYSVGVLGTTIKNEVTNIGQGFGADSLLIGGDLGNGQRVSRSSVGNPIGYFYGYEVEGVFQNQAEVENSPSLFGQKPGDLKYKDINGDGVLDGNDRTIIGNSIPDFVYGFNAQVGYKTITLSADFQGQAGNYIYNGKQAIRFTTLNYEARYNDYWDGEGSTNENFRPSLGGANFQPSSYFVEDGSYLRLRSLTLNYAIPNGILNKMRFSGANVYVRGTNIFTLTKYSGFSPEIGASNAINGAIDTGVYPITRVFSVGLNANF